MLETAILIHYLDKNTLSNVYSDEFLKNSQLSLKTYLKLIPSSKKCQIIKI